MAGERTRIGVWVTPLEREIFAACGRLAGDGEAAAAIRACGVVEARAKLARVAPAELARIDRRFGGGE
jgi:hypothetical protein